MMSTSKKGDTGKAVGACLVLFGILFLIDRLMPFAKMGLSWVMYKDNLLLYAAVCFLLFKRDKSVGLVLLAIWAVMNVGLVMSLLGTLSGYLLPLVLLLVGLVLLARSRR